MIILVIGFVISLAITAGIGIARASLHHQRWLSSRYQKLIREPQRLYYVDGLLVFFALVTVILGLMGVCLI